MTVNCTSVISTGSHPKSSPDLSVTIFSFSQQLSCNFVIDCWNLPRNFLLVIKTSGACSYLRSDQLQTNYKITIHETTIRITNRTIRKSLSEKSSAQRNRAHHLVRYPSRVSRRLLISLICHRALFMLLWLQINGISFRASSPLKELQSLTTKKLICSDGSVLLSSCKEITTDSPVVIHRSVVCMFD